MNELKILNQISMQIMVLHITLCLFFAIYCLFKTRK